MAPLAPASIKKIERENIWTKKNAHQARFSVVERLFETKAHRNRV
jgi:hypothetical protein